ncbi:MAG: Maf family protein [Armatimonadota bacterium]|nr:Maf family protein [Armatimonadota bacterium]
MEIDSKGHHSPDRTEISKWRLKVVKLKRSKKVRLVLVSASPRRQELLKQIGVQFEVCPSPINHFSLASP